MRRVTPITTPSASTTNNKFGFTWKPIDQLMFRGTRADGFRAPTIADLYGGGSQTFSVLYRPLRHAVRRFAHQSEPSARAARQDIDNADTYRQLQQGFVPTTDGQRPDAGRVRLGFQPAAGGGRIAFQNPRRGVEPGILRRSQHEPGLVADPHRRHHRCRYPDTTSSTTATSTAMSCRAASASRVIRNLGYRQHDDLRYQRNAGYVETEGFDFDLSYKPADRLGQFRRWSGRTPTSATWSSRRPTIQPRSATANRTRSPNTRRHQLPPALDRDP